MTTTSSTSKALITAAFIAGGATTLTARQLFSSANAASGIYRFQNDHVWVASLNPDGGIPTYAGRTCGFVKAGDAGVQDVCSYDGAELSPTEAKAFEVYLKARGIAAPRK